MKRAFHSESRDQHGFSEYLLYAKAHMDSRPLNAVFKAVAN